MNLSEVLTGATALVVAMLVARSESGLSSPAVSQPPVSQPPVSQLVASQLAGPQPAMPLSQTLTISVDATPDLSRMLHLMPPPLTYGRARMIHAPTPCDVPTFSEGGPGAPYFVADGVPQVGQPFRVGWTTKPTTPGESPAWPAMLLVSFGLSAPLPLASIGAPGCHLLVQPDYIMMPRAGSILTQFGGCINLDWTPRGGLAGFTFYAQLLVSAPGVNTGGFLVSPALHVEVGS